MTLRETLFPSVGPRAAVDTAIPSRFPAERNRVLAILARWEAADTIVAGIFAAAGGQDQ